MRNILIICFYLETLSFLDDKLTKITLKVKVNMKEIDKPKYNLNIIKSAFKNIDKLNMTYSAMRGQYELGFSDQDVVDVVQAITNADFCKSMQPKHSAFSEWQDVYKPTFKGIKLYVKFQVDRRREIIISFKAR